MHHKELKNQNKIINMNKTGDHCQFISHLFQSNHNQQSLEWV